MPREQLVPRTVYGWKERFLAGGRGSPEGPVLPNKPSGTKRRLRHSSVSSAKYAVANDVLKKALEGRLE